MTTKTQLNQAKVIVEGLLKEDERCRNSDKWLIYQIWLRKTGTLISYDAFLRMPSFESIRRVRQKIQNEEKKYLPTDPQVMQKRQLRRREIKEWCIDGSRNRESPFIAD